MGMGSSEALLFTRFPTKRALRRHSGGEGLAGGTVPIKMRPEDSLAGDGALCLDGMRSRRTWRDLVTRVSGHE